MSCWSLEVTLIEFADDLGPSKPQYVYMLEVYVGKCIVFDDVDNRHLLSKRINTYYINICSYLIVYKLYFKDKSYLKNKTQTDYIRCRWNLNLNIQCECLNDCNILVII